MTNIQVFEDEAEEWNKIRALYPWDLIIHGGTSALETEHRCRRVPIEMNSLPCAMISRPAQGGAECLVVDLGEGLRETHFSNLGEALGPTLERADQRILLDITSIEVDVLMHLMPLLARHTLHHLSALFVSPTGYAEHGSRLSRWTAPIQPPGYVTFRPALVPEPRSEHWILLGFDEGRVHRIVRSYDWETARIHVALGDPPYFPNGDQRAKDANQDWLDDDPGPLLHQVPASDPFALRDLLRSHFRNGVVLDILPLGPKPMVLGALLFYFALSEMERDRVRFLYDFPEYHRDHTTGVGTCFRYDLTGFAK